MNDELEEDEDLHNKLKNDHKISDEQIIANSAKISPESARVAQLTQEIDMLEEDSAESKSNKSKLFDTKKATTEDIESWKDAILVLQKYHPNSVITQLKATIYSNRAMKVEVSSSFVQSRGICEYVPQYAG